jgi:hypothetical protein
MSITMIGLDTAKSVFQVHGVNETGKVEIKRKLRRSELIAFFERDRPKPGGEQLQDGTSAPETNFSRQPESAVEVVGRRGAIAARGTFTPKFWTVSCVPGGHFVRSGREVGARKLIQITVIQKCELPGGLSRDWGDHTASAMTGDGWKPQQRGQSSAKAAAFMVPTRQGDGRLYRSRPDPPNLWTLPRSARQVIDFLGFAGVPRGCLFTLRKMSRRSRDGSLC